MRPLVAAIGWSAFAVLLLMLAPGHPNVLVPCARLVAASDACRALQAQANELNILLYVWPMLGAIGLGYLVISVLAIRSRRSSSSRQAASG